MCIYGLRLERVDLRFCVRSLGDAAGGLPPMVKRLRNMSDFWFRLTQAQHEFEILHPVEGRIEPRLRCKRSPHTKQVADIHRAAKIFRRPVRFEKGLD